MTDKDYQHLRPIDVYRRWKQTTQHCTSFLLTQKLALINGKQPKKTRMTCLSEVLIIESIAVTSQSYSYCFRLMHQMSNPYTKPLGLN